MTETWATAPHRPISKSIRQACLVNIYPSGSTIGSRFALGEVPVLIGRGEDCNIRINDHSVSRKHARIELREDGYFVVDMESTNGTFVNDASTSTTALKDGDYLRIGNCIYRYLAGGNVEAEYHEEIYRLIIIDALTGIHNKRYLLEFLDREIARSARHHRPLAMIMIDIDWFKAINDDLGHLGGDYVLREVANCVKANVRREDLCARHGGEEYVLVLVETTHLGAMELAERIRKLVESRVFEFEDKQLQVTVSLGVASTAGEDHLTPTDLIRRADDKLFEAKRSGRNRVAG